MSENQQEIKKPLFEDYVGQTEDGQQMLVTVWAEGNCTVSFRPDRWATWSRPIRCTKVGDQ